MRLTSWLLMSIMLVSFLFLLPGGAMAQEVRRDKHFGTFHEGMRIESEPGEDRVITVSPPPPPVWQQNSTPDDQHQSTPIIVVPEIRPGRRLPPVTPTP